ncbi:MAG: 16S rRNA (guanine(966)-N(2))-methyltransferase RsmD [Oscillospiraceae bacterium]|nr:16S rRNA (guanine(966)-N(2))-methyltransferase RsmD [Oscillospiraceae bacterium]
MRIITGIAKGVNLNTLSGNETRPTSDKIKEAIFSAIQFDVEDAVVLDLFAGSGQLGIEALSRGAKFVYFSDNNFKAVNVVKSNLAKLENFGCFENVEKFGEYIKPFRVDKLPYHAFLKLLKGEIDIAFLDPPYERGLIAKTLPILIPKMNTKNKNPLIVCEHEKQLCLPKEVDGFEVVKNFTYGTIAITIYRQKL